MSKVRDFKSIIGKYDVVFFDAYGVLKNYNGLIPGIENTIRFLIEENIDFYVLTNDASRSPDDLAASYQTLGIKEITADKIISSGMLAREYLRYKVKKGTAAYLGTSKSAHYIETQGLNTLSIRQLDLDKIDDVNVLVLLDDEGFDWKRDINKVINLLRKRNIPVIVANTDFAYPVTEDEVSIAIGGLSDMIETIVGRRFIKFGKPDSQMFMFAYERIQEKKQIGKEKIVMVGDTLKTDILGGNKFGIDTILVLSGNTLPDQVHYLIRSTGIIPNYICEDAVIPVTKE
ncbi:MAG TPA: TIGR01459 family HAD-type hydrolase [Cyclobacteriaceae bacterium]|nr:TIGR01459 family HAD-type hydrolase [Cyclobacteriaceae bacterium]